MRATALNKTVGGSIDSCLLWGQFGYISLYCSFYDWNNKCVALKSLVMIIYDSFRINFQEREIDPLSIDTIFFVSRMKWMNC